MYSTPAELDLGVVITKDCLTLVPRYHIDGMMSQYDVTNKEDVWNRYLLTLRFTL